MAEVIFRYINGVLRPITVNKVLAGQGAGAQRHRQVPKQTLAPGHYRTAEAFTVPNASCQLCGAQVFYYEHPNGARVLFDELGPPWPKHPCYEAGQIGKSATSPKMQGKAAHKPQPSKSLKLQKVKQSPNWAKLGWQPLVYEKDVLLQSGQALRVQARASDLRVRFEIPLTKLQKHGIAQHRVKDLLMLAKVESGAASVQLHDGVTAIALRGVVTDNHADSTGKSTQKPTMLPLSQKQLQSLTKLDGPLRCYQDNDWQVELVHASCPFTVTFKEKAFQHLVPVTHRLEVWVSKPSKKGNQVVYILDRLSRQFVTAVIPASGLRDQNTRITAESTSVLTRQKESTVDSFELLQNVSISSDSKTAKIVSGTLGDRSVNLMVANKLFRMGELPDCFAQGKLQILLRPVEKFETSQGTDAIITGYWFYVKNAGEKMPKNPRGLASAYQPRSRDEAHLQVADTQPSEHEKPETVILKKRIRVGLKAIDFTNAKQIVIDVMEQQTLHRLRLRSNSDEIRERVESLLLNPTNRKLHLVQHSEQSYAVYIDRRFLAIAIEVTAPQPTVGLTGVTESFKGNTRSIASIVKHKAHLDAHTLGAALLDAVKSPGKGN
ncbi:hypothetical protein [Shewanella algae]|uniref:hypothetical protein n=1 Tax=Shewanella algae TaxID=38313 RepID=UPI001AAFF05F|nr:hypothetical protein [Shewanella algae]EKT4487390.1 hypothetical protein [Shewanella algae]MBO2546548.1 hypothetical protein [Shewanella algae]